MRFTSATRSRPRFWRLLHSARLASSGVSMPTKTWLNPASTIWRISSSSSARLIDASVKKARRAGRFCHWIRPGSNSCLRARLLPMKLSSTKNTDPSPAEPRQPIQLGDHLRGGLGAGPMSEQGGDVAELAVERATARELNAHARVAPQVGQFPHGRRRVVEVGHSVRRIHAPGQPRSKSRRNSGSVASASFSTKVVNLGKLLVFECEQRAARHDRFARGAATRDRLMRRLRWAIMPLTNTRSAQARSPRAQPAHVHVHQAFAPGLRQHPGHGQQAQRRQRGALADELQGVLEAPERVRELRVEQQHIHALTQSNAARVPALSRPPAWRLVLIAPPAPARPTLHPEPGACQVLDVQSLAPVEAGRGRVELDDPARTGRPRSSGRGDPAAGSTPAAETDCSAIGGGPTSSCGDRRRAATARFGSDA
jgi:hypothetical protein